VDEVDPARMPNAGGFPASDFDERLRSVDVCRAGEASAEQLMMDDADSTANVQHGRIGPWPLTQCSQQSPRRWQRPAAMVAAQILLSSLSIELVFDTAALTGGH